MKISLNWLTDYVDVKLPAAELAAMLMRIGFPVEDIQETDSDIVLDVEVTSNRPDCLGHIGVAREIAAAAGLPLKLPDLSAVPASGSIAGQADVAVLDPAFCPRYTARLLRGVKVRPSPAWLVERIEAVGMRSINNVVDATNYVLMEYSQPLHAFDFDKLQGGRIVVRRAVDGEQFLAIDGSKCELRQWMGVIADERRPVALAGVMGGIDTEVSENTVNVLIEAAQFDPLTVRRGSRALGLMSESSYRFERGIDPVALERASLRCCQIILQTGGGQLLDGIIDACDKPPQPAAVSLRTERCTSLLGMDIPVETQQTLLGSLGLQPRLENNVLHCVIPSHRADLTREVDLIEEVGRLYGYDKIPTGSAVTHQVHAPSRLEAARRAVAETLNAAGYFEAITFTFIDAEEAALFGWRDSLAVDTRIRKTNNMLRQGLLPSLLRARKSNQDAGADQVNLFELSAAFPPAPGDNKALPQEHTQLALLTDGAIQDVRGAIEALVKRFHPGAKIIVKPAEVTGFVTGAAAEVILEEANGDESGGTVVKGDKPDEPSFGVIGQVSQNVCDFYGLSRAPVAAMLRFDRLLALGQAVRRYVEVPRFPAIRRDLSVLVDESVAWQPLADAVATAAGELFRDLEFVGVYRGKQIGAGKKSMTLRLTFRHNDRTLRHEEVDSAVADVINTLKQSFSAELRA